MFRQLSLAAMLMASTSLPGQGQALLEPALRLEVGGVVYASPTIGPDGLVIFGAQEEGGGALYAYSRDGQQKWRLQAGDWVDSTATISPDGVTVYVGSWDGSLYGVDIDGGGLKWSYTTSGYIISSPAVSADGQSIYIGSGDGFLYALSPPAQGNSMVLQWDYLADGEVESSPVIGPDGDIYFCSVNGTIYAVHPDGSTKWVYEIAASSNEDPRIYSSPAMDLDGALYVGAGNNQLLALNSETGELIWNFETWGPVDSSPAIDAQGNLYFADRSGTFFSITAGGTERWSHEVGISLYSSPAIGERDRVYATGYLGGGLSRLYAFSLEGDLLWTHDFTGKVDSSPTLDAYGDLWIGSHASGVMRFSAGDAPAGAAWPQFRFNHERRGAYAVPIPSRDYFAGAHESLGGWIHYPRLGWAYVSYFPWIYQSEDHGWWWAANNDTRFIVYDAFLGWTYTDLFIYPTLYSYNLDRWQTYVQGISPERTFYAFGIAEPWIIESGP